MKQLYLRPKDVPAAIKQEYGYELTKATLNRWRKRHPLPFPARVQEVCVWFEKRIMEKRLRTLPRQTRARRRSRRR